jgi:hypothetical protein
VLGAELPVAAGFDAGALEPPPELPLELVLELESELPLELEELEPESDFPALVPSDDEPLELLFFLPSAARESVR